MQKEIPCKDCNKDGSYFLACYAAIHSHVECLKYAHENGYYWSSNVTKYSASHGSLKCLKYAHENGCPWYNDTIDDSASAGHLECLNYAHRNGCSWDSYTTSHAAYTGYKNCLNLWSGGDYPISTTFPKHYKTNYERALYNRIECIIYIYYNSTNIMPECEKFIKPFIKVYWIQLVNIAKAQRQYVPKDIWDLISKYW
jgi:hypothetical protein